MTSANLMVVGSFTALAFSVAMTYPTMPFLVRLFLITGVVGGMSLWGVALLWRICDE